MIGALLLCGVFSGKTFAQGRLKNEQSVVKMAGLVVNADQMSSDFRAKSTTLKGNIQIVFRGQHLSCDQAKIDYRKKEIVAQGNVKLQTPTLYAEATALTLNYEADTAVMENGIIQSGQVVFEGSRIEKTGPNTFVAENAQYTACASCPPAWSFSGRKIEAELGGYAKISRPVMRIGGIPFIILPGILVPLKSARQSGFLVPSLDYSSTGGLAISESFFWAIDQSKDATLTAKYYELRGLKGQAEYRYVLSEQSNGALQTGYIKDRAFTNEYKLSKDVDRWFLQYQHYFALPDNFIQRANIRQASDLRYLRDFPDELEGHGDPAIESRVSLTKNLPGQHLSIEAAHYKNLLKTYPLAENDDSVHRFPEIRYSITDKRILNSPLLFRLDASYVNFARDNFGYDDMSLVGCPGGIAYCASVGSKGEILRDGSFDPTQDKIRTGQRFDFKPTLALPFSLFRFIEVVPQVTYRETQYRFQLDEISASSNYSRSAAQRYLETEISAKTSLSRVFGNLSDANGTRIKHEIEPQISFSTLPWVRRADHSFFGEFAGQRYSRIYEPISDTDLYGRNKLQFDYNDRIFDKQLVELALTNRLTRKRWRNGFPSYERIANFRLSQSYDINESKTERPQPWSAINGLLNIKIDNFETYTTASYNPYAKVTNTSARVKFFDELGNYLQTSYERIYLINEENEVTDRNQTENIGLGLGLDSRYAGLEGQVDYSAVSSKILSWQYVALLKPPGNCWTIRLGHKQVIGGEPEFRFNFSFDFGGS